MIFTSRKWANVVAWVLNHVPFGPRYQVEVGTADFDPEPIRILTPVPDPEDAA